MARFSKDAGREVLGGHVRLPPWIAKEHVRLGELHAMKAGLRSSGLLKLHTQRGQKLLVLSAFVADRFHFGLERLALVGQSGYFPRIVCRPRITVPKFG